MVVTRVSCLLHGRKQMNVMNRKVAKFIVNGVVAKIVSYIGNNVFVFK